MSMTPLIRVRNPGYMRLDFWSLEHFLTAYKGFSPLKHLTIKDRRTAAFDGTMVLFNLTLKGSGIVLSKKQREKEKERETETETEILF